MEIASAADGLNSRSRPGNSDAGPDDSAKRRRSAGFDGGQQQLAGGIARLLQMQQLDRHYDAVRIRPR